MRYLLALLLFSVSALADSLPAFIGGPTVTLTRIGETIFSGDLTANLRTNNDAIYWETNTANGGLLPIYAMSPTPLSYNNMHPDVATFDGSTLTFIDNGTADLFCTFGFADRRISKEIRSFWAGSTAAGTNYVFATNTVESLAHHVSTNTFARLTGTAATRRSLWSARTVSTTNYTRNQDFFLADVVGLEAYPGGNNAGSINMNGCLVSPRHILSVSHTGGQLGEALHFVNRTNNAVLVRTVVDSMRISLNDDMTVGVLDQPLPASIAPAVILTNAAGKLPSYTNTESVGSFIRRMPVVAFSQLQTPGVHRWVDASGRTAGTANISGDWGLAIVPGDSGSPCFAVVANRLAFILNWTSGGSWGGSGNSATAIATEIQTAMNTLCSRNSFTNETLSHPDLSAFTSF